MNFSAIGVSNFRRLAKSENCRDFVDVSRATFQVPNGHWIPRELVASRIPKTAARPSRVMRVPSLSKTTKLGITLNNEHSWSLPFLTL